MPESSSDDSPFPGAFAGVVLTGEAEVIPGPAPAEPASNDHCNHDEEGADR